MRILQCALLLVSLQISHSKGHLPSIIQDGYPLGPGWSVNVSSIPSSSWTATLCNAVPPAFSLSINSTFLRASLVNISNGTSFLYQRNGNYAFNLSSNTVTVLTTPTLASVIQPTPTSLSLSGYLSPGDVPWSMVFSLDPSNSTHLLFNASIKTVSPSPTNTSLLTVLETLWESGAEAGLVGLGTQYSFESLPLSLGTEYTVLTSEQGVGRGLQPLTSLMDTLDPFSGGTNTTTYSQFPTIFSESGWGFSLDTQAVSTWGFHPTSFSVSQWGRGATTGRIFPPAAGPPSGGLLGSAEAWGQHIHAGATPYPSWWDDGAVIGLEGGTGVVIAALAKIKEAVPKAQVAGVWLQDWSGAVNYTTGSLPRMGVWWNWELNHTHYPHWHTLLLPYLSSTFGVGTRVLTYINPYLTPQGPLFAQALALGHLVPNNWRDYGGAGLVNLVNASTRHWYGGVVAAMLTSTNASGFMADFGEGYPILDPLKSESHGEFPGLWAETVAQGVAAGMGGAEGVASFMRSSSPRSPSLSPLFWLGDQTTTWDGFDGLASVIPGLITASLSGAGLIHSDIGGYTELAPQQQQRQQAQGFGGVNRSKELFQRWAELSAFTFGMRTHLGSLPSSSWQLTSDNDTIVHFFHCVEWYVALGPYRRSLAAALRVNGTPPFLPTRALFPTAPWDLTQNQFMLGPQLLVAPVLSPSSTTVRVWLPRGVNWTHLITGKVFVGEDEYVVAQTPIGTPFAVHKGGLAGVVGVAGVEGKGEEEEG